MDESNILMANEAAKYEWRPGNGRDLLVALADERVSGQVSAPKEVFVGEFQGRPLGLYYTNEAARMAVLRQANRTLTKE